MGILQQPFATLRALEKLGIATVAIQQLPILDRREALKAASGEIEPFLRKRHLPPFVVLHDPDFDDLSGMTGGAVPTWSPEQATQPRDITVTFPAGGTVGVAGITYTVNLDAGAYGSAASAAAPFPLDGVLELVGYPFELPAGATINAGDTLTFSLRTDAGLMLATVRLAAYMLRNAIGVDAKTMETLEKQREYAMAWGKAVADGDGDLGKDEDATPLVQEGGFRFPRTRVQRDPYAWARRGRGGPGNLGDL